MSAALTRRHQQFSLLHFLILSLADQSGDTLSCFGFLISYNDLRFFWGGIDGRSLAGWILLGRGLGPLRCHDGLVALFLELFALREK